MPLNLPTLNEVRGLSRDFVSARLAGYDGAPANNRARVLADGNGALAYDAYRYIDELAEQFLPDTATGPYLDRWADIYLGGRQAATHAQGAITVTGLSGVVVPEGTEFSGTDGVLYAVTSPAIVGVTPTTLAIEALTAGVAGNLQAGATLSPTAAIAGLDASAVVVSLTGGVDVEDDESLRDRVLFRVRKPPMGGDADDYVAWARSVPGVTRAWCSPNEFGIGTVTVRFMMDVVRAAQGGIPNTSDVAAVQAALDLNRPVGMRGCYAAAPVPEPISFTISNLAPDTASVRAGIAISVAAMLADRAAPARAINGISVEAQTAYREWVSAAILNAPGVSHFDLTMDDHPMPYNAALATLGTITYA